jgi:hypothetical protein
VFASLRPRNVESQNASFSRGSYSGSGPYQNPPTPVPDTPLPPGAVPDTPTGPPTGAPGGGGPGASGPGGSTMTVDSMTMVGSGCPIGAGGLVTEVREGLPVFMFTEWNLDLTESESNTTTASVDKFCQEEMKLSKGPLGMQFRIGAVSVSGWADLKAGSKISITVETRLGEATGGVSLRSELARSYTKSD